MPIVGISIIILGGHNDKMMNDCSTLYMYSGTCNTGSNVPLPNIATASHKTLLMPSEDKKSIF